MFWDKGYTPSQNIEALLQKENATVEEFLDDEDILQECKTQKNAIVNYFNRPEVIKRLVELITTEPSEDLPIAQRYRYANMACEILTVGLPSLDEKLLSDSESLNILYSYLEKEPPLNPLLSSFFSKTFSMLFTRKFERDWFSYQTLWLKLLQYIKSQNNFLDLICKHFGTPIIPDLIMQMMKDVNGGELKRSLYEWLTDNKLVERLIAILDNAQESDKHANVAEFLCDLILQGRTMRQSEQDNDSFKPAFDGSNPVLLTIESEETIVALLNVILKPNAPDSAIVSGISVVLTLIKLTFLTDEPNSDQLMLIHNRERNIHEDVMNNVIHVIAPRLEQFNELLRTPPKKKEVITSAAVISPPFGMTRLQICRMFTVLLQTGNEEIFKAICEIDYFENLLDLFMQYCWNNFLHSEVEKCLQLVFNTQLSTQDSKTKMHNIMDIIFDEIENLDIKSALFESSNDDDKNAENVNVEENENMEKSIEESNIKNEVKEIENEKLSNNDEETNENSFQSILQDGEKNVTKTSNDFVPSALQIHVIVKCKLISKLIDCWQYNKKMEGSEKGRRLGYMGHLIKILKHVKNFMLKSEKNGALIENTLKDADELKLWRSIIDQNNGDLSKALSTQNRTLADCNVNEAIDYDSLFEIDNNIWDILTAQNVLNSFSTFGNSASNVGGRDLGDEDDDDDDNILGGHEVGGTVDDINFHMGYSSSSSLRSNRLLNSRSRFEPNVPNSPWDGCTDDLSSNSNAPWVAEFNSDNFADFDAHFSSFSNDLGECIRTNNKNDKEDEKIFSTSFNNEEYDNNANVEKSSTLTTTSSTLSTDKVLRNDGSMDKGNDIKMMRTLQPMLQDSEDDYDDDEGMWTKPLGSSANTDEFTEKEMRDDDEDVNINQREITVITNGPNKVCLTKRVSEEELNNAINSAKLLERTSNSPTNDVDCIKLPNVTPNNSDIGETIKPKISTPDAITDADSLDASANDIKLSTTNKPITAVDEQKSVETTT